MRILVTGHLGFIGSHVFWELREAGHHVRGIDKKDEKSLNNIHDEYDAVVHCAANLFDNFDENYEFTKLLITKHSKSRFIFTSSAAVYGNANNASEDDTPNPFGEYGEIKLLEEKFIEHFCENHVIFRLGNVCGYNSDHGIYSKLINGSQVLNNRGEAIRDFVHVEDVVWAIRDAIELPGRWNGIYNIATGKGTKIINLFKHLNPGKSPLFDQTVLHEIDVSILNIEKARKNGYGPRDIRS
jgi:UDP-glucose 4-epimerase